MNFNYEERQKILSILENKKNTGKRIKVGVLDDGKIEKKSEYFSDEKDIHLIDNKERFGDLIIIMGSRNKSCICYWWKKWYKALYTFIWNKIF
ncbi:hypothetical protein O7983_000395 [Mycoplasmopsis felis]|uniref:hypothetical protein n=1 Tax=Mycoplasmopsis felis TaxID=33923 RepID=UPI003A4D80DA